MIRLGVFATGRGWLLARPDRQEFYPTRDDAVAAAVRDAHVARWRGDVAEVLAQDGAGELLKVVEAAAPTPASDAA